MRPVQIELAKFYRAAALMAAILSAFASQAASAARSETTKQMQKLSPAEADRQVRRDLLSILEPVGKIEPDGRIVLRRVRIYTTPYATEFGGLCRKDELSLRYGPVTSKPPAKSLPIAPVGLGARASFHIDRGPIAEPEPEAGNAAVRKDDCRRLRSGHDLQWFYARDNYEAAVGVNLLLAVSAGLESGQLSPKACDTNGCSEYIRKFAKIGSLNEVHACDAPLDELCYELDVGPGIQLTVKAEKRGDPYEEDRRLVSPGKILSLEEEQFLTLD